MDKESWRRGGDPRPDPRGETSLDELAKGLANGTISRRQALRWMGGALAGAALASVPGVAFAAEGGNSACDEFCHANFSGRAAGQCTSAGAHGTGPCYTCTPGIGPGPNFTIPPCSPNEVFNPQTCACACAEGFETCQGACVPVCPTGTQRNPETCLCEGGPNPECAGATCQTFVECSSGNPDCVCVTTEPGTGGLCVPGTTQCLSLTACGPNFECPEGQLCAVNTCCIDPVCVPISLACVTDQAASDAAFTPPSDVGGPTIGSR
jgi:hypothetical protein